MSNVDKLELYRQHRDDKTGYVLFIEYQGRRFLKMWSIADDAELEHIDVLDIMVQQVHEEIEWDDFNPKIGSPVNNPLPEWIHEGWVQVDLDNV